MLEQLALRFRFTRYSSVDVRALAPAAFDKTSVGHDLKLLEGGDVAHLFSGSEHLMNFADGAGATLPEGAQYLQLGIGRTRGPRGPPFLPVQMHHSIRGVS